MGLLMVFSRSSASGMSCSSFEALDELVSIDASPFSFGSVTVPAALFHWYVLWRTRGMAENTSSRFGRLSFRGRNSRRDAAILRGGVAGIRRVLRGISRNTTVITRYSVRIYSASPNQSCIHDHSVVLLQVRSLDEHNVLLGHPTLPLPYGWLLLHPLLVHQVWQRKEWPQCLATLQ